MKFDRIERSKVQYFSCWKTSSLMKMMIDIFKKIEKEKKYGYFN